MGIYIERHSAVATMLVLLSVLATLLAPPCLGFKFGMPTVPPTNETDIWAVLVAGSNGWYNYRHQADVCHAYQILHAHGIPDDHIIVMMMDDIANNTINPHKGKIINRPDGPDVYRCPQGLCWCSCDTRELPTD